MKRILANVHIQFATAVVTLTVMMLLLIEAAPFLNRKVSLLLDPKIQTNAASKPAPAVTQSVLAERAATESPALKADSSLAPEIQPSSRPDPVETAPPPVKLTEVTAADAAVARSLQTNQTLTVRADYSALEIARWVGSGVGQLVAFSAAEEAPNEFLFRPHAGPGGDWATNRFVTLSRLGLALSELGPLEQTVHQARAKAGAANLTAAYVFDPDMAGQVRTKVAAALRRAGADMLSTNITVRGELSSKAKTGRPTFRLQSVAAAGQPPITVNDLVE